MRRQVEKKLERIAGGAAPRVFDLFAGCGGMTLGFVHAGFQPIGGVELDPDAAHSYAHNFHRHESGPSFDIHAAPKDITTLDPLKLLATYGELQPQLAVDVLVGGPPCPAFTRVGRAKLREVNGHAEAFKHDPRAKLYVPYLRFVEALAPVALLMENVPDVLNFGGHNVAEEICDALERMDYRCTYSLLNAANYGVPQMRERFFLVAVHRAAGIQPHLPAPSHRVAFPTGYSGSRDVALKHVRGNYLFSKRTRYVPSPTMPENAAPPISVRDAIVDLPAITGHLDGTIRRGARRFDSAVTYRPDVRPSKYALHMRRWPGFSGDGRIWDHTTRSLSERDYRLFARLEPGDDYPKAFSLAEKLFARRLAALRSRGINPAPTSAEFRRLRASYVPPYDPGKFPNKWRKMEPDLPARTLMAHLGKDSYSHIHFDDEQARTISVREAARLQSFPDGFVFKGTMNPAFRQIGNAVPPLMAAALARSMALTIRGMRDDQQARHQAAHAV